jgi:dTDP-4-amino-4,6-dideoxygalactose transaminase
MNYKEVYGVTEAFERAICEYTGAPYCVAVDSCSSALLLSLLRCNVKGEVIKIPACTYMSVPCSVIMAGGKVKFIPVIDGVMKGAYRLDPTNIYDSALRFTADMYSPDSIMCLSFSGVYKHLKLGKGGAILTDNEEAYRWFKKARFSGRNECSYHIDTFDQLGLNCYMLPEIAARGLLLMNQFYNLDGTKKDMPDIELPYPDLSLHPIYKTKW